MLANLSDARDLTSNAEIYWIHVWSYLRALRLNLQMRTDMMTWKHVAEAGEGMNRANEACDPTNHHIADGDGFWLSILNRNEEFVGCVGCRIAPDLPDIREELLSGRLWWSAVPVKKVMPREALVLPEDMPTIQGRVALPGSLWIHPDLRGHGLGPILSHLTKIISVATLGAEWVVSMSLAAYFDRAQGHRSHLTPYTRVPACRGEYPPYPPEKCPAAVDLGYLTWGGVRDLARDLVHEIREASEIQRHDQRINPIAA